MSETPIDDDLHEAMARFSAAANAQPIELPPFEKPARILVAFDQSNQDEAVAALAAGICTRFSATAVTTLARPGLDVDTRRKHLESMHARLAGVACEIAPQQDDDDPADRLIDARDAANAGMIIMPAPYLEDLKTLGRDSVGSTAERVLARAKVPVLFAREPGDKVAPALNKPLIKLHVRQAEAAKALSTAFGVGGASASYRVLFVIDAGAMAEAMALLGQEVDKAKLTDQALLDDAQAAAGSLVAAAQHWAMDHKAGMKVEFKIGSDPDVTAREGNDGGHLLVLPCPADRNSGAYSRALTVLRLSSVPVLMV
ncbi:MAG: universal stress protein [Planctomycetes bacterium]|nr:universal stress protein [Planctomycetota bacterium]